MDKRALDAATDAVMRLIKDEQRDPRADRKSDPTSDFYLEEFQSPGSKGP